MFYGRQVVYPPWLSDGMVSSVWQSAAEVYTPFDYLGESDTGTRIVTRKLVERLLDRARWQSSRGFPGKAMSLAKNAAHLSYENGYEDLLNEARRFVTHELEPGYLDGVEGNAPLLSVLHDRKANVAWVWLWGGEEDIRVYLDDHRELFESGQLHLYYYGVDPDSAVRAIQWLEESFDANVYFDPAAERLLYSAVT